MSQLTDNFDAANTASSQTAKSPLPSGFDTVRFFHVLNKTWLIGLLIMGLAVSIAYVFNRYNKPLYTASTVMKLSFSEDARAIGLDKLQGGGRRQKSKSLSGEIEIIKSDVLYEKLLSEIDLGISYFDEGSWLYDEKFSKGNFPFKVNFPLNSKAVPYDTRIRVKIDENHKLKVQLASSESDEFVEAAFDVPLTLNGLTFIIQPSNLDRIVVDAPYVFQVNSHASLMRYLDLNLQVEILNLEANTLRLVFSDYNKVKAKTIVEQVVKIYLETTLLQKQKSNAQTLSYLDKQLDSTRSRLEDIESKMQAVSKGSIFNSSSDVYATISEQIEKRNDQRTLVKQKVDLLIQLEQIIYSGRDLGNFIPILDGLENASLSSSINNLNTTNKEFQKLKESHKANTLSYKNKEIELKAQRQTIDGYISQNKKNLLLDLALVEAEIKEAKADLKKLPSQETDMVRLKRYYNLYEGFFIFLNQKKVEFETTKAGKVPDFLVLSNPTINNTPVNISPLVVYGAAAASGFVLLFILFGVVFLLENKILNQKELERLVDVSVIGTIPKFKKKKMQFSKLQVIDYPQSIISESFRHIRSNLGFFGSKEQKVITVSSTIGGEGKTFVTLNLAGILALSNKRVIVLDFDMRKPKLHYGFDTHNDKGVSDVLAGKESLTSCIQKSDFEGLDYITAGNKPPNPSELILSQNLDQLIESLKSMYDFIIFDTPPIGLVTDGVSIMSKSDVQLYVARAGYTKISMVKEIENIKKGRGFKNFSIILNDVSASTNAYGYSGYGYGNGYYDED